MVDCPCTGLVPLEGVLEQKGLGPLDDSQEAKRLTKQSEKLLMLVGHLPHLRRLASLMFLIIARRFAINQPRGRV